MKRGTTLIEIIATIVIVVVIYAIMIALSRDHRDEESGRNDSAGRFEWSNDICPRYLYAYTVKDTKNNREYLVVRDAGVIELRPTETIEKENK